jgi:hypothetical protein
MKIIFQPGDTGQFKKIIHTLCKTQSHVFWTFSTTKLIMLSIYQKDEKKAIIRVSIPSSEMEKYVPPTKPVSFCINCSLLRNMSNIFTVKDAIEFSFEQYLKLKVKKEEKILRIGLQVDRCHTPEISSFKPTAGFKLNAAFFCDIISQLKCSGENIFEIKKGELHLGCQVEDNKIKTLSMTPDQITGEDSNTTIPSNTLRYLPGKSDLISEDVKVFLKEGYPLMIEYHQGVKVIIFLSA